MASLRLAHLAAACALLLLLLASAQAQFSSRRPLDDTNVVDSDVTPTGFEPLLPTVGRFTIVHTGDTRAACLPVTTLGAACDPTTYTAQPDTCFGGFARRQTFVQDVRESRGSDHVVLADSGGFLQGSLFYGLFHGQAVLEYMNDLQYNTSFISSREFFDGPDNFLRFMSGATFNTSAYNLDASASPLDPYITPYELFKIDGHTIAFVCVVRSNLNSTTDLGPDILVSERNRALRAAIQELNDMGIRLIVGVFADLTLDDVRSTLVSVPNIDAVIVREFFFHGNGTDADGPYPFLMESPTGWPVPVVASGYFGSYVGLLDLEFDALGRINSATGDSILIDETVPMDPTVQASVEARQVLVMEDFSNYAGETLLYVNGSRDTCRVEECAMGVVITEAMYLWVTTLDLEMELDFALFNSGGIRSSWEVGAVTNGDVFNAIPFGNTISRFSLLGEAIPLFLENSVAYAGPNDDKEGTTGRFLQMTNLSFTWNYELPAMDIQDGVILRNGSRVVDIKLNGASIDPTKYYNVATNDFIRNGGDDYFWFQSNKYVKDTIDQGITNLDSVTDYLGERSPISIVPIGRIILDTSKLPFDPLAAKRPSNATTIALQVIASICIAFAVCLLLGVVIYRHEGAILSATPLFLVYIILGGILVLCAVYILSPDPTAELCVAVVWVIALGFSLFYASLLVKNWRVAKILGTSKKFFRKRISLWRMTAIVLVSILGNVILLIIFTAVDTPFVKHNKCKYQDTAGILIWVILAWNAILIIPAVWISWQTKHVSMNFNESKHIGWATYNITFVSIILVPVLATSSSVETQYIILCLGIIMGITCSLALLFIPKLIAAYHKLEVDEINTIDSTRSTKTSSSTL